MKVLLDDATVTQAETIAAIEAARAICCLVQTGQIIFILDGSLIEEWDKNTNRTKIRMKVNTEERRKIKRDFPCPTDLSRSNSASLPTVISASISAKEVTSSRYFKLGVRPKAQPASIQPCPNCCDTAIPPWRDKSLW